MTNPRPRLSRTTFLPLLAAAFAALSFGCADAPGTSLIGDPNGSPDGPPSEAIERGAQGQSADGTNPGTNNPPGTTPTGSGTTPPPPPPPRASVFDNAPGYSNTLGGGTLKGSDHNFGNPVNGDPAKQACLTCHSNGGGAPNFALGGTAYEDAAGTTPAVGAEIRMVDTNGMAFTTHTDARGNFYIKGGGTPTYPAHVGARNAAAARDMSATITNGDCNGCHDGKTTGFILVK